MRLLVGFLTTLKPLRALSTVLLGVALLLPIGNAQTFSVLYDFGTNNGDPLNPYNSGVISQGRDGKLYSSALGGKYNGGCCAGTIFSFTSEGALRVLYNFSFIDGENPESGVTLGTDGNFYGTTVTGTHSGTIFKITPTGTLTTLYEFTGGSDGATPFAPPIQGRDGNLYGTTFYGGDTSLCSSGCGTIYKLTPSGVFTTLYQFDISHGQNPYDPLVQDTAGDLYGTTMLGGTGAGVVFKITTSGTLTVLYNFDGTHGAEPTSPLIQGRDGNLYGTATTGGANGAGNIFKITRAGNFAVLRDLNLHQDGAAPFAGLVQANDGNFYGATSKGGSVGYGTIFKMTPKGKLSVLYNFDNVTGNNPVVTLVQHTNGTLYGDTVMGGDANDGVFYSLDVGLSPFVSLLSTSGKVGRTVQILGQGFTGTTDVSFNGTPAAYTIVKDTFLKATVPVGATTGFVTVTTLSGTLKSNKKFRVKP